MMVVMLVMTMVVVGRGAGGAVLPGLVRDDEMVVVVIAVRRCR